MRQTRARPGRAASPAASHRASRGSASSDQSSASRPAKRRLPSRAASGTSSGLCQLPGFNVSILAGSPFADFLVPGLILGGLFGVGSLVVAAMGLRHARVAPFLAFAIGCAQMIWIAVELAIIGELSWLHPMFFGIGLALALAAVPWGMPTFEAWRRSR